MPISTSVEIQKWRCSICDEIYDTYDCARKCEERENGAKEFFIKEIYFNDIEICNHGKVHFKFRMIIEHNEENISVKHTLNMKLCGRELKFDYDPYDKLITHIVESIYFYSRFDFQRIQSYLEQVSFTIFVKNATPNEIENGRYFLNLEKLIEIKSNLSNINTENIYSSKNFLFRKEPLLIKQMKEKHNADTEE